MGGYGSGRTGGVPTVEGCGSLILNINEIMRQVRKALRIKGLNTVPHDAAVHIPSYVWGWRREEEPAPWAVADLRLEIGTTRGTARLCYDIEHVSGGTGPQSYVVSMVTTPCRFGGRRWWWLCPRTGRKVAKLYLPNGGTRFLSRGRSSYQLAYASQRENKIDRMHRRAQKIHRKLGGERTSAFEPFPAKPPRMWTTTYSRLCHELSEIEFTLNSLIDDAIDRRGARLAQRDAARLNRRMQRWSDTERRPRAQKVLAAGNFRVGSID